MVLKKAASIFVRLGRIWISRPLKPLFNPRPHPLPTETIYTKYPSRFSLFPSIYQSVLNPGNRQHLANSMPFRMALNDIKRRMFFAAPSSSRLFLGLLGYSLVQQTPINRFSIDETFNHISHLLSKTTTVTTDEINDEQENSNRTSLNDYELGRLLGRGCNAVVYEARLRSTTPALSESMNSSHSDFEILSRQSSFEEIDNTSQSSEILPAGDFNLAIKMLFNYGIQSNAEALEKAMDKELLPLNKHFSHPNIVRMYSRFVDSFPLLNDAFEHYPMAIPTRLSADGFGRNKTLFIVMKRYDLTLKEYLQLHQPTTEERLVLFAQLMEALLYLNNHSIVHRDLKSDNLLICNSTGELVLADFGCALYHPPDLKVPYATDEVSKGGNLALMAPEICTARPGPQNVLDYRKSDLWASGTLLYEFFSQDNPFFHGKFQSEKYDEQQLPSLSSTMLDGLVHRILQRNPEKRPSITLISNAIHVYLWFNSIKSSSELYQNYVWKALETFYRKNKLTRVEFNLKKLFFQRQTSRTLFQAQALLHELEY